MFKTKISHLLRKIGLLHPFYRLYFRFNKIRFNAVNKKFIKENPSVVLPPSDMLFEAHRMDYNSYFYDGRKTAEEVVEELSSYFSLDRKKILDWGCGPARIARHLPILLPFSKIYGSDYNEKTIQWCKQNINGVNFFRNNLTPPLPFEDNFFDAAYGFSVFTHLSEQNHYTWMNELYRVIKPGGIFFFTSQGTVFVNKLSAKEKKQFLQGKLVVRDRVKEGHRTYSAFQPETFVRSMVSNRWKILKFISGEMKSWGPEQDTWIIQKELG